MKPVYEQVLDMILQQRVSDIPYVDIVNYFGLIHDSRYKDTWERSWRLTLNKLEKERDQKVLTAEITLQFMRMFRSMILLDPQNKSKKEPRFKYKGPKDKKNRSFCHVRAGNKYTRNQILSWQDLQWDGKIDDGGSIFIDLGGYNCRHYLDPLP